MKLDKSEDKKRTRFAISSVEPNFCIGTFSSSIFFTSVGFSLIFFSQVEPGKLMFPGATEFILIPFFDKGKD